MILPATLCGLGIRLWVSLAYKKDGTASTAFFFCVKQCDLLISLVTYYITTCQRMCKGFIFSIYVVIYRTILYFRIHIVYNISILYITSSINEVYYAKVLSLSHNAESHD